MADDRGCTPTMDSPGRRNRDTSSPNEERNSWENNSSQRRHSRSRSRSRERTERRQWKPLAKRDRQRVYDVEGTNTTRREAHLKRARLFVGNVDPIRVHRRDLLRRFQEYGEVLGVSLHQGYAFVQLDSERNANRAINFENGAKINSTRLHVEFSQAALHSGARFKPLDEHRSPIRDVPPPPPPPASSVLDQDDRLSRVLSLQRELDRELSYLVGGAKDEPESRGGRSNPDNPTDSNWHYDNYSRGGGSPGRGNFSRGRDDYYDRRDYQSRPFSRQSSGGGGSSRGYHDRGGRDRGFESSRYSGGGYSSSQNYGGGDQGWSAPDRGYPGNSWH